LKSRAAESGTALAALFTGAACIGIAPLWVRWTEVGPVATAFYRMALALPFLWLWQTWAGRAGGPRTAVAPAPPETAAVGRARRTELGWLLGAGLCFAVDLWTWHLAIRHTTVANATLLPNFAPVVVAAGAWFVLGERVGRGFVLGLLVALAGAALLVGASFDLGGGHLRGDAFGLLTALSYGGYQFCVKVLRRTQSVPRVMVGTSAVAAPALWLIAWLGGEAILPDTARGWAVVIALALTAQVAGQSLIAYGFAHLPGGFSSLTLLLQPVVAALAGWLFLHETMGGRQLVGGLLILGGLLLAKRGSG
jgi:drug/metabolite transporter (DMT)-like permease